MSVHNGVPALRGAVIIGGAGFIGRHLCQRFQQAGYAVVSVGRSAAAPGWPYRHIRLDLGNAPAHKIAVALARLRPQVVVNATGGIWGLSDSEMWTGIAAPTLRLLAALTGMAHPSRLVHLGSVLEHGPVPTGTTPQAAAAPRPRSAYSRAKFAATQAVLAEAERGRLEAIALRLANVIGPGAPSVSLLGRVAAQLLTAATAGEAVVTLDALDARRDYVHVQDVADAVLKAAESTLTHQVIDIGRGEAVPTRSVVELLLRASSVPARIVVRDRTTARLGHSAELWTRVDPQPARELLGWRPKRSLCEAVTAYWHEVAQQAQPAGDRSALQ